MNGKLLWNGTEVNLGDIKITEFTVPEEYKNMELTRHDCSGSLEMKIPLNPLYKRQQETGIPRRVKISFLANL